MILPMFPLGTVTVPGAVLSLHVFEPRYRRLVADVLEGDRQFGVVLIERGSEVGGGDQRFSVGTSVEVVEAARLDDGRWALLALGRQPIVVERWLEDDPYPRAEVRPMGEQQASPDAAVMESTTAAVEEALRLAAQLGEAAPAGRVELPPDPASALWHLCAIAPIGPLDRQRLLEAPDAAARARILTLAAQDCAEMLAYRLGLG